MPGSFEQRTPSRPSARVAAAASAAASLLLLAACGGGSTGSEEGSAASAATGTDTAAAHDHEEGDDSHTHGEGTHTHASADTMAADVALAPDGPGEWSGSATLLSVGDSVRVLVSVEGMEAGSRRPIELVAGGCEEPGPVLVELTPLAAGASGSGTSQTAFASSRLEGHDHGALRLPGGDGATAACAPVHLSTSEHGHAE